MIKKRLTGKFGPVGTIRDDSIPKLFLDLRKPKPIRICTSRVGNKVSSALQAQQQRTPTRPRPSTPPQPQTRRSVRKKAEQKLRNGVSDSSIIQDDGNVAGEENSQVPQNTVELMTPIVDENGQPVVVNVTIETSLVDGAKQEDKGQNSPNQRQNIFAALASDLETSPTKEEFMTLSTAQDSDQNLQPIIDVQDVRDIEGLPGVTIQSPTDGEVVAEQACLRAEDDCDKPPELESRSLPLNKSDTLEEGEIDFTGMLDRGVPIVEQMPDMEQAAVDESGPALLKPAEKEPGEIDLNESDNPPVLEREVDLPEAREEREPGEVDMSEVLGEEGRQDLLPILVAERPQGKSPDPHDSDVQPDVTRTPPAAVIVPRKRESDSESEEEDIKMRDHIGDATRTYAKPGEPKKRFTRLLERETDKPFTEMSKQLEQGSSHVEEDGYELVIEKEDVKLKTKKRRSPSQRAGSILEKKRGIGVDGEQQSFEPPTESTEPGPSGVGRIGIRTRGGVKTRGGVRTRGGIHTRGATRSLQGAADTDEEPTPRPRRKKDSDIVEESVMPATGQTNVIVVSEEKGQVFVSTADLGDEEEELRQLEEEEQEQTNVRATRSRTNSGKKRESPRGKPKRPAHPLEAGSKDEHSSKNIKAMFYGKGQSPRTSAPWEVKRPVSLADRKMKLSQKKKQIQEEALKAAAVIGRKESPTSHSSPPSKKKASSPKETTPRGKKSPDRSPPGPASRKAHHGGKRGRGGRGPPYRGFRQVNPIYANFRNAAVMAAAASPEPMVIVSKPIRVNYFKGQSVKSGRTQGAMTLGYNDRVRVPKVLYDTFELEVVGTETLALWRNSPADINELKGQVQKEMEHKRKEHIMPLVLQMSNDEIEKNYSKVKERIDAEPVVYERDSEPEEYYLSPDEREEADSRASTPTHIPRKKAKVDSQGEDEQTEEPPSEYDEDVEEIEVLTDDCDPRQQEPEIIHVINMGQREPDLDSDKEKEVPSKSSYRPGPASMKKRQMAAEEVIEVVMAQSPCPEAKKPEPVKERPKEHHAEKVKDTSKSRESSAPPSDISGAKLKIDAPKTSCVSGPSSPRSSFSEVTGDKPDMLVDFSLLENPMDTDNEGVEPGPVEETSSHPLHTPPMTMDSDQEGAGEDTEKRLLQASVNLKKEVVDEPEEESEATPHVESTPDASDLPSSEQATSSTGMTAFDKALLTADSDSPKYKRAKTRRFIHKKPIVGRKKRCTLSESSDSQVTSPTTTGVNQKTAPLAEPLLPPLPIPVAKPVLVEETQSFPEPVKPVEDTNIRQPASLTQERVTHEKRPQQTPHTSEKKRTKSSGSESSESGSPKKRKTAEEQDADYKYTAKRSGSRHNSGEDGSSGQTSTGDDSAKPERKSTRKRKPTDYVAMVAGNYDPSPIPKILIRQRRKYKGSRSMQVKLNRKIVDTYLAELLEKQEREREEMLLMSGPQKLASDNPLENSEDPLWQAQKERLADLPSKSGLKPSTSTSDDSSPDSAEPNIPKKPPKKKQPKSMHQKLSTAFVQRTPKKKRKPGPKNATKMMQTLSVLHQATLEKLEGADTPDSGTHGESGPSSYSEEVEEDHTSQYDDVMQKLAYFSPHHSENEEGLPTAPLLSQRRLRKQ